MLYQIQHDNIELWLLGKKVIYLLAGVYTEPYFHTNLVKKTYQSSEVLGWQPKSFNF